MIWKFFSISFCHYFSSFMNIFRYYNGIYSIILPILIFAYKLYPKLKQNFKLASTTENETCFHLLHLSLLRDYITLDVGNLITEFTWDKERIIDDIVLLIMFVGNDFLPHLPRFDIAHGTLDLLMEIYPIYLSETKEYLQDAGTINMKGLSIFFEVHFTR